MSIEGISDMWLVPVWTINNWLTDWIIKNTISKVKKIWDLFVWAWAVTKEQLDEALIFQENLWKKEPIWQIFVKKWWLTQEQLSYYLNNAWDELKIWEILIEKWLITFDQLNSALELQKINWWLIWDILLERRYISEKDILVNLARKIWYNYIIIDDEALKYIWNWLKHLWTQEFINYCRSKKIFPINYINNTLTIAMWYPISKELTDITKQEIEILTGWNVRIDFLNPVLTSIKSIRTWLSNLNQIFNNSNNYEHKTLLTNLFWESILLWASDFHVFPQNDWSLDIKLRINWDLDYFYNIPRNSKEFLNVLKLTSSININAMNEAQNWVIHFDNLYWHKVSFRVASMAEYPWDKSLKKVTIRVIDEDQLVDIGNKLSLWFNKPWIQMIDKIESIRWWISFVTWPTWHGKTATLYAILNDLSKNKINISTLEDPIERRIWWIDQNEVNKNFTLEDWLISLLRHDIDVIMAWELRRSESARIAIEHWKKWHLLLSTLHTGRAALVPSILKWMWVDKDSLSSLNLVITQNLVKKLCSCAENFSITDYKELVGVWIQPDIAKDFCINQSSYNHKKPKKWWCSECKWTWFKWRIPVSEFLYFTNEIKSLLRNIEHISENELLEVARLSYWMNTLKEEALWLFAKWQISLDVLKWISDDIDYDMKKISEIINYMENDFQMNKVNTEKYFINHWLRVR